MEDSSRTGSDTECAELDASVVGEISSTHGARRDGQERAGALYDAVMAKYKIRSRNSSPAPDKLIQTMKEKQMFNLFVADQIEKKKR